MTINHQPPSQKLEKDKFEGSQENLNNLSSSSSSSSSQPIVSPYQTFMRYKKGAGLENQAEFFCPAMAKEKD
jgi:hypothetical protein